MKFDNLVQDKNEVIKLSNILMKKFSAIKLELVVFSTDVSYKTNWAISQVKNFDISENKKI